MIVEPGLASMGYVGLTLLTIGSSFSNLQRLLKSFKVSLSDSRAEKVESSADFNYGK